VSDDLLDVVGTPAVTGKPRGLDLRDGNPSLPIVLALRRDPELARLFAREQIGTADVEAGLARIRRAGVLGPVAERVREHARAALEALGQLQPSACRTALEGLAHGLDVRPS